MKQINFLSTLAPVQQRSITKWYRVSWCLFIILMLGIGTAQVQQLLTVRTTLQEHRASTQHYTSAKKVLDKIDCLKVQEKQTGGRHAFIASLKDQQKKTIEHLKALSATMTKNGLVLESLAEKNGAVELTLYCTNAQQGLTVAKTLAQLPHLKTLRLISLQPGSGGNKAILATFKGTL